MCYYEVIPLLSTGQWRDRVIEGLHFCLCPSPSLRGSKGFVKRSFPTNFPGEGTRGEAHRTAAWETPKGFLWISSDGDDRRIFLCFKCSIPGFFGWENLASSFLGGLIEVGIFWGVFCPSCSNAG